MSQTPLHPGDPPKVLRNTRLLDVLPTTDVERKRKCLTKNREERKSEHDRQLGGSYIYLSISHYLSMYKLCLLDKNSTRHTVIGTGKGGCNACGWRANTATHVGVHVDVLVKESASPSNQTMLWMFMGPRKAIAMSSSKGDIGPLTANSWGGVGDARQAGKAVGPWKNMPRFSTN